MSPPGVGCGCGLGTRLHPGLRLSYFCFLCVGGVALNPGSHPAFRRLLDESLGSRLWVGHCALEAVEDGAQRPELTQHFLQQLSENSD